MILTVNIPDELKTYLEQAAVAAGQPDLKTAVSAHLAALIRDAARRSLTANAMAAITDQVTGDMAAVDAQNALIQVEAADSATQNPSG